MLSKFHDLDHSFAIKADFTKYRKLDVIRLRDEKTFSTKKFVLVAWARNENALSVDALLDEFREGKEAIEGVIYKGDICSSLGTGLVLLSPRRSFDNDET